MRALAKLQNLKTEECKRTIVRNLSRILDIRIIDIDVNNGMIFFLYGTPIAFQKVKQELWRIGYPMQNYKCQTSQNSNLHISSTNQRAMV